MWVFTTEEELIKDKRLKKIFGDDRWITIHPHGKIKLDGDKAKGQPVLIREDGTIVAGLGSKHHGKKINELKKKPQDNGQATAVGEEPPEEISPNDNGATDDNTPANEKLKKMIGELPTFVDGELTKELGYAPEKLIEKAKRALWNNNPKKAVSGNILLYGASKEEKTNLAQRGKYAGVYKELGSLPESIKLDKIGSKFLEMRALKTIASGKKELEKISSVERKIRDETLQYSNKFAKEVFASLPKSGDSININGLADVITNAEVRKQIEEHFKGMNPITKKALLAYQPFVTVGKTNKTACYTPETGAVAINANSGARTVYHELGHFISDALSPTSNSVGEISHFGVSFTKELLKAKGRILENLKERPHFLPAFNESLDELKKYNPLVNENVLALCAWGKVTLGLDSEGLCFVTDWLSGVNNGNKINLSKFYVSYGHNKHYWMSTFPERNSEELFANLFALSATNPKEYEALKQIIPTTLGEFEKLITNVTG